MPSPQWLSRFVAVVCALASTLVLGGEASAAAVCSMGSGSVANGFSYVDIRTGNSLYVCLSPIAELGTFEVFLTPSETTTSAGTSGVTVRVKGGACVAKGSWWVESCVSDPQFTVSDGVWVESASTIGASADTTVRPCVTQSSYPLSSTTTLGTVCVHEESHTNATLRPDRTFTSYVAPGLCVSHTQPTYGYTCWFVNSWTYVDGRGTVPVFREVVGVCDGPYSSSPCTVRHERAVP